MEDQVVSVSEFVALVNQTMEYAYPIVRVEGEISELKISKNRWVYFNLKDENSSIRVFGTVYQLREAFEDGMKVVVKGSPKLHNKYGFSLNISSISASGEGSIKRAFELMKKKLEAEGLFDLDRKRPLPELPAKIGLITSAQAAAYEDFMKILNQRWSGVEVLHADVAVQGESAPRQICNAIKYFAEHTSVDVLVITRGGGGAEDLMAFSDEEVARAVAGSRVPTLVGVGHEVDISLADLAADVRATTPTNAAQLVVPDKSIVAGQLDQAIVGIYESIVTSIQQKTYLADRVSSSLQNRINGTLRQLNNLQIRLSNHVLSAIEKSRLVIEGQESQLKSLNPKQLLSRGYSLAMDAKGKVITDSKTLKKGQRIVIHFSKGQAETEVIDAK